MSFCLLTNLCLVVVHIRSRTNLRTDLKSLSQYFFSVTFAIAPDSDYEVVYVTIGNPDFYLALSLTGIHFQDKLQHVLVTWVSKKSGFDQSQLEKKLVSDCHRRNYMLCPWGQGPIIWYQFGKKTCYIPKASKFMQKKDFRVNQQTTFNPVTLLTAKICKCDITLMLISWNAKMKSTNSSTARPILAVYCI